MTDDDFESLMRANDMNIVEDLTISDLHYGVAVFADAITWIIDFIRVAFEVYESGDFEDRPMLTDEAVIYFKAALENTKSFIKEFPEDYDEEDDD